MELLQTIETNYDLKPVTKIEKTLYGSGNTYIISTGHQKYIAKVNERIDFVSVYEKVQCTLNKMGIPQSRNIRTNEGLLMTLNGLVLYEFIDGSNYKVLNHKQTENAIKFIEKYNQTLSFVPFGKNELEVRSHWDKVRSIDFLINELLQYLLELEIDSGSKKHIVDVIRILSKYKSIMSEHSKQLIHSDLGADNFIFDGDEVISIIDFTPDYNNEIYSLAQFIYWNYLWCNENINIRVINEYLEIYNSNKDIKYESETLYLFLFYAVLYRIAGPLMERYSKGLRDCTGMEQRFSILSTLLSNIKM